MENIPELKDANIDAIPKAAKGLESSDAVSENSKKSVRTFAYINKQEAEKAFCEICDFQLSADAAKDHVLSEGHIGEFRRHGCDGIMHNEGRYRCGYCDERLRTMKRVYHHVKTKKHLKIVAAADSSDKRYRVEKILKNNDKNINPSFCITVAKIDDTTYFCHVCRGSGIFLRHQDVDSHIGGNRHRESLVNYGCDKIAVAENDNYYCQSCDCEFLNTELGVHVRSRKHFGRINKSLRNRKIDKNENSNILNTLKKSNIIITNSSLTRMNPDNDELSNCKDNFLGSTKETPVSSINVEESNGSEDINSNASSEVKKNWKKTEDIFDAETELHRRLFTSISGWTRQSYVCLICITKFNTNYAAYGNNKDKLLSAHIRGEKHAANVVKYGCDKIVSGEVNKYYCECCNNEMLGTKLVRRHISSENHLRLVKTNLREKISFGISSNVSSFIYVIKQNSKWIADTYYCWICDDNDGADEYQISQKYRKDHVKSKLHKDSLKKYGCDDIVRRYNDNYYCHRCDTELDDVKKVFFHIKEENHLKKKRIVAMSCSKNMISNFILQENTNDSECVTNRIDPKTSETMIFGETNAKKVNDEPTNRDLSLHYISSDPNVLCRGTIPKSMQIYAKKIVKQQIDDPYCLICNFEIPGYPAVDDHINGKFHIDALLRNGCNKVFIRKTNDIQRFTCGWCIGFKTTNIEAIYRHIRTKDHLSRVRYLRPAKCNDQCEESPKRQEDNSAFDRQNFTDLYKSQRNAEFDSDCVIANEGNNEKSLNFNSIFSSISDDLSRMLAHFEESNNAKVAKKKFPNEIKFPMSVKKNVAKKVKKIEMKKKKRFAETSPDRGNDYICTVCETTFARKAELHCHMANHFGEEFGRIDGDIGTDSCDAENSIAGSQSDDSSPDDEENSKNDEKRSNAGEKNSETPKEVSSNLFFR